MRPKSPFSQQTAYFVRKAIISGSLSIATTLIVALSIWLSGLPINADLSGVGGRITAAGLDTHDDFGCYH